MTIKLAPKLKSKTLPFDEILKDDDASHQNESISQFARRDAKQILDNTGEK